jgi:ribosomal protein S18 acetylase RimI-like enzyme
LTLNVWADNTSALGFYENLGLRKQKIGMELIL